MITLAILFIGVMLVGITFSIMRKNQKTINEMLDETMFDKYNDELNDTAIAIYDEIDEKYKEMLIVYDLIDKKTKDFEKVEKNVNIKYNENINSNNSNSSSSRYTKVNNIDNDFKVEFNHIMKSDDSENIAVKVLNNELNNFNTDVSDSPKSKQEAVKNLLKKGFTSENIAKELGIGIGEVRLIAELSKVKNE